ncbi:hypothetical protein VP1G_05031 [Cytospora mali]|uniref:Stc1 domain-containing protein n=1 Tax=Cytospora mali TaxID=578113 RepID=A0A194V1C1_CYTMA|nr:hypothetical protein VP1G_05031 [Valsa mali var. pyri (nom. inval.)]
MSANYWSAKKNQGLPDSSEIRIKCIADGRWELKDMFSKNMLQKHKSGQDITCRKHTPGSVAEIVCVGCHRSKPLNCFSNSARKVNGSHRCRDCVEWSEADCPGYNPLPPPNAQRSVEERELYNHPQQTLEVVYDNHDDEDEYEYATETDCAPFSTDQASSVGRSDNSSISNSNSLTTYALQNFNASNPAYSRSSQSYQNSFALTDTASTTGTKITERPRSHVHYNAYGPKGQVRRRIQSVVAASETTATFGATSVSSSVPGRKNWAKPDSRKTAIVAPSYLQYENPDNVGHAYDSDESADNC